MPLVDPDDGKWGKYHQPRSTAMNVVTMVATVSSSNLQKSMCIAQDATFELMDALLLTRKAQSLADLSL